MTLKTLLTQATVATLALTATLASAQQQGVSKDEIVIGSIQDLSGPIAGFGKQIRSGMQLAVDELNEQNGINGRKIKLIIEDSAYDPKKAVLAAQKLVNQDKIFAMLGRHPHASQVAPSVTLCVPPSPPLAGQDFPRMRLVRWLCVLTRSGRSRAVGRPLRAGRVQLRPFQRRPSCEARQREEGWRRRRDSNPGYPLQGTTI